MVLGGLGSFNLEKLLAVELWKVVECFPRAKDLGDTIVFSFSFVVNSKQFSTIRTEQRRQRTSTGEKAEARK